MKNFKKLFICLIFFGILFSNLFANDNLQNKIYKNLRCIVCQGQSIADSNSDFANTIKSVVNDKVKEGMNEKQIYNFLSQKYGDWILYNPPLKGNSYLLWILPYVFFIIGAIVLFFVLKKTLKHRRY